MDIKQGKSLKLREKKGIGNMYSSEGNQAFDAREAKGKSVYTKGKGKTGFK